MFDLAITGGSIIDGKGRKAFPGDIGIRDGRITVVGKIRGRVSNRIPARGLAIAPGFIDIHGHSDYHLLVNPEAESKVHQGITTEVGGNCGYSAAPVSQELAGERRHAFPREFGIDHRWRTVSEYLARLKDEGISINFALLCGHNTVRASVIGGKAGPPRRSELNAMLAATELALDEGAVGISTGLAYAPASFADVSELVSLGALAAERRVMFSAHIRSEGKGLLEALDEFLTVGYETGASLEISHLKTMGKEHWHKLDSAFARIERARKSGIFLTADRYPYTAANTSLLSLLPGWALTGSTETIRARLEEPRTVRRLVKNLSSMHSGEDFWRNVVISQTLRKANRKWEGKDVISAAHGADPAAFVLEILRRDHLATSIHVFSMSEKNLARILKKPWVMIGSDSAVRSREGPLRRGIPHPRSFGTYPRVLGTFVREQKLMSLERAVQKMTSLPARKIGLKDRGSIRVGAWADLVVFSRDMVADRSLFHDPFRYPSGIEYVIINGRVVLSQGVHTGARPGRVITSRDIG